tara:strand:- start:618 stop:881 length:264 start_codon:yes stop_codon:yes gene_type:complete
MEDHKEMEEEDSLQPVEFLERLDMNLLKLKKVSTKNTLLMDKRFKISRTLEMKIKMENSFRILRKNQEEVNHKTDNLKTLLNIWDTM